MVHTTARGCVPASERGSILSDSSTTEALAQAIAKRFIQRKDVKAIQVGDGGYRPVREPWKMGDLRAHVAGEQTFGHYTCDTEGLTKLIVFDCDLDEVGNWVERPTNERLAEITSDTEFMDSLVVHQALPRKDWHNRRHPGRPWFKYQMRVIADTLTSSIQNNYGMDCVTAYSGNKGVHVYAFFPEPVEARVARKVSLLILEGAGKLISPDHGFERFKGENFFKHAETDPYYNLRNFTVEVFPKQDEVKDLGNLVRLPTGKNLKNPADPCFFVDQRLAQTELKPHPFPAHLLQSGDPFASDPS